MAQLVAEEYRSGTINQLFCYPIERWRLMFAKAFDRLCVHGRQRRNRECPECDCRCGSGQFDECGYRRFLCTFDDAVWHLLSGGLLATAFLSLLPYVVCMRRKSTSSTIVAGVVLTIFLISSAGGSMTQATYFFRSLTLGAVALIIVLITLVRTVRYIGENDVL